MAFLHYWKKWTDLFLLLVSKRSGNTEIKSLLECYSENSISNNKAWAIQFQKGTLTLSTVADPWFLKGWGHQPCRGLQGPMRSLLAKFLCKNEIIRTLRGRALMTFPGSANGQVLPMHVGKTLSIIKVVCTKDNPRAVPRCTQNTQTPTFAYELACVLIKQWPIQDFP